MRIINGYCHPDLPVDRVALGGVLARQLKLIYAGRMLRAALDGEPGYSITMCNAKVGG